LWSIFFFFVVDIFRHFFLFAHNIGGHSLGRVKMELFADKVPKTAENFRFIFVVLFLLYKTHRFFCCYFVVCVFRLVYNRLILKLEIK
jgi:hypothetical protein